VGHGEVGDGRARALDVGHASASDREDLLTLSQFLEQELRYQNGRVIIGPAGRGGREGEGEKKGESILRLFLSDFFSQTFFSQTFSLRLFRASFFLFPFLLRGTSGLPLLSCITLLIAPK
jgi:hypothetical protein